ncbi:MAG: hypothetical protein HZB72_03735 [Burkholderiales bacterium]|nr:hypothetical protein [Burkholderiales bacterium]
MPRRRPPPLPAAVQAAEIAWAAPQVIALRSLRMLAAGHAPSARDRREFTVMGTEKVLAWQRSMAAMGQEALRAQQDWMAQAVSQGMSWWTSPWTAWSGMGLQATQQVHEACHRVLQHGLHPVHSRVTANARRLRKG